MIDPTSEYNPDETLAERLENGDADALAQAFSRHSDRLRRTAAFRMDPRLRGRLDADDILQEAYLEASSRLEHFAKMRQSSPDRPRPVSLFIWLRLIVQQTLVNAHRRHLGAKMRDATREMGTSTGPMAVATHVSLADRLLGHLTSPSKAAMRAELSEKLRDKLSTMSHRDQEIIAMRHFEHLSNSEVAETLEIEIKAASIRYVRAIKRLKELLEDFSSVSSVL